MSGSLVPIATYSERSLFRRCHFKLFADHVELRGRRLLTTDFEGTVGLATISPYITRLRVRHPWWPAGLIMQIIPYSAFFILHGGKNLEHGFSLTFLISIWIFTIVFGGIGLWLIIVGFPKREFVVFRHRSGATAFDVCRAGSERIRFDEFVSAILLQAERCQSANHP
ncbi:MAG: hypothetical protein JO117_00120, partial [Verrucomicrobia bacterium]|nr:hypothetical protein [Verrucomicrobiota bacterium]